MAAVTVCIMPLIAVSGIIMSKLGMHDARRGKDDIKKIDHYEESNALLGDLILNYRTIISFGEDNVDKIM